MSKIMFPPRWIELAAILQDRAQPFFRLAKSCSRDVGRMPTSFSAQSHASELHALVMP